jgi:hypothetical protein
MRVNMECLHEVDRFLSGDRVVEVLWFAHDLSLQIFTVEVLQEVQILLF